jgi:prepilin-type N-terminal cleavage/methylation domain-containing protein
MRERKKERGKDGKRAHATTLSFFHSFSLSRSRRGFTLLELIIYLGIVGLVLSTATLFAFEFVSTQAKSSALEEVNRNARYAIARIGVEIREASDLNIGASTFNTHPGVLSLGTLIGGTDPTVFTASSATLNVQQGVGPVLPITSSKVDVTEFIVEDVSVTGKTKAIRVRLKLKSRATLQEAVADTTVETTAKIKKNDGFSN